MQLKIQRSQRMGGVMGGTILFCLDVRADYSAEEQDNIRKYRLGGQIIYSSQAARRHLEHAGSHLERTQSRDLKEQMGGLARGALSMAMAKMSLNISIASLGRGHHIECKDLPEMLEAEETVRGACRDVTRFLDAAATFNGSEVVIEYEKGEERVHIAQHAPPLIAYQPESGQDATATASDAPSQRTQTEQAFYDMGKDVARSGAKLKRSWRDLREKAAARGSARGWALTNLHLHLARAATEKWLSFEAAFIARAEANGTAVTRTQIRAVTVGVVLVALVVIVLVL